MFSATSCSLVPPPPPDPVCPKGCICQTPNRSIKIADSKHDMTGFATKIISYFPQRLAGSVDAQFDSVYYVYLISILRMEEVSEKLFKLLELGQLLQKNCKCLCIYNLRFSYPWISPSPFQCIARIPPIPPSRKIPKPSRNHCPPPPQCRLLH